MTEFVIKDEELTKLKDKVIVVTGEQFPILSQLILTSANNIVGCASGIGKATVEVLLSFGAFIVGSDLNTSPTKHVNFTFVQVNVTEWTELRGLFKTAAEKHGRIDHVYANAGISSKANYIEDRLGDDGELLEPDHLVFDINLKAVVNTAYLAIHHIKKNAQGGSIALIGSTSSFQQFRVVDYAAAKHGVLGLMRGLKPLLDMAKLPIRVNMVAPSWTLTGLVPPEVAAAGKKTQPPEVVGRQVALLMADENRDCQIIYSYDGRQKEIEQGVFQNALEEVLDGEVGDDIVVQRLYEMMAKDAAVKAKGS